MASILCKHCKAKIRLPNKLPKHSFELDCPECDEVTTISDRQIQQILDQQGGSTSPPPLPRERSKKQVEKKDRSAISKAGSGLSSIVIVIFLIILIFGAIKGIQKHFEDERAAKEFRVDQK